MNYYHMITIEGSGFCALLHWSTLSHKKCTPQQHQHSHVCCCYPIKLALLLVVDAWLIVASTSTPIISYACASVFGELFIRGQCASDLAELPVRVIWQRNCLSVDSVPVIWQNCIMSVDSVPVIRQNCLWYVDERASDMAELAVPVILVPVILQNCLYVVERASDLADLPLPVIWQIACLWKVCQ
jgi:hypothetical protein